jgi:ABC-2 type transport system permease protein
MNRLRPGSFAWLAAHDLRQSWRSFDAALGGLTRVKAALLVGAVLAVHAVFWWALRLSGPDGDVARDAWLSPYIALGIVFVLPGIVVQAMTAAARALHSHGDLELMFASPVSARAVLGARALSIAISAIAWFAILLFPLADVNALAGRLHWLAIYPALVACGLFGAGIGIGLALAFVSAVGPRRARLVSQIAATIVGASFVLAVQGYAMAPAGSRASLMQAMQSPIDNQWLDWRGWLLLPARAATGEAQALGLWMIVAIAVFAVATFALGKSFASAAISSAAAGAFTPATGERKERAFRGSLGATLRSKERRLILRDPWLISQIVLQLIYMLPISFILWRNGGATGAPGIVFTPLIVVVGAQLAGSLAWLALSAEDAPDLLRAAPVSAAQIERHKIQAILAPVALLLGAPIIALAFVSPWSGLCAALFTLGAGVSTALLNLWRQSPSRRGLVLRRHSQSKFVGMIEHLLSIVWAVGAVIAVIGSWSALVPVALACFILWLSRSRSRRVSLPANA